MTLTQTYRLAHRARGKLSSEASRVDHDLRLLVGHANLLDSLMIELQDAEKRQDSWFEQSIAPKSSSEPKHVAFVEQHGLDVPDASDDEEDESDSEDEDTRRPHHLTVPAHRQQQRARSPPAKPIDFTFDDDEAMADDDDESDNLELSLVRTRSHSADEDMPLPELVHESDSEDSDEEIPSPPADLASQRVTVMDFAATTKAQRQQKRQEKQPLEEVEEEENFLMQAQVPLVACC